MSKNLTELNYNIYRFPTDHNPTLRAWSAAEEYIVDYTTSEEFFHCPSRPALLIINDRFGFLSINLFEKSVQMYLFISGQIQLYSIIKNLENNQIEQDSIIFVDAEKEPNRQVDFVYILMPKSLELFNYYLQVAYRSLKSDGRVLVGFMTRHFTGSFLAISARYFDQIQQTKAKKKSRLIILSGKRENAEVTTELGKFLHNGVYYYGYPGVFSSAKIDNASIFLLQYLADNFYQPKTLLDLACGNGVLGIELQRIYSSIGQVDFIDDFHNAILSAKMNARECGVEDKCNFYLDGLLEGDYPLYDMIVCNPPFHIEHEIDIQLPIRLFRFSARQLSSKGVLILVANRHLNYTSVLRQFFTFVNKKALNSKYEILECGLEL